MPIYNGEANNNNGGGGGGVWFSLRHDFNYIYIYIYIYMNTVYRLRNVYPESVLKIHPHFHYCLLLWGSVVKENYSLHLLQKKALRIITNSDYLAHTEPLCKRLRILKISDMFSMAL